MIENAISRRKSGGTEDQAGQRLGLGHLQNIKNQEQARENNPSAKLKAENQRGGRQIDLSSFVVVEWLACWAGARLQRSGGIG